MGYELYWISVGLYDSGDAEAKQIRGIEKLRAEGAYFPMIIGDQRIWRKRSQS